ncbi:MAG: PEGA domain-containing protein [Deltaproteobacteria bacterium]|nr:PEGA domain-containing protein [Deltaproteobacteria bacterium]
MSRALAVALLLAGRAAAQETLAILAVADPPGPEPELAEMTHHLRAACRERTSGVQEVPEMRQRLLGQSSNATLAELERAYGGALATYQNGEYPSSIRTLYAILDDLERLPEGPEAYSQWVRAQLRLAHAEGTIGHLKEEREAWERLLAIEPRHQPDPDQYSPTYRRDFDAARARLAVRPRRRITVDALGWSATIYVSGRNLGPAPVTVSLPPGRYRVGGAVGSLRVPSVFVELKDEDRTVSLDFGLAEALRVNAGPGLALASAQRPAGVVRAGAWLGADRVLATSIAIENDVPFLVGSLYDIRRGALQREGRVRMAAGAVPSANLAALAAFLLTGQQSKVVVVGKSAPVPLPVPPPVPVARAAPSAEPKGPPPPPLAALPPPAAPVALSVPTTALAPAPSARPPLPGASPGTAPATPAAPSGRPAEHALASVAPGRRAEPPPTAAPARALSPPPPPPPAAARPADPPLPAQLSRPEPERAKEVAALDLARPAPALEPGGGRTWYRPAMWGSGAAAVGLGAVALWQGLDARSQDRRASAMVSPAGTLHPGIARADYDRARASADASRRSAWIAASGSLVFAVAAGAFGWLSFDGAGQPVVRF